MAHIAHLLEPQSPSQPGFPGAAFADLRSRQNHCPNFKTYQESCFVLPALGDPGKPPKKIHPRVLIPQP